ATARTRKNPFPPRAWRKTVDATALRFSQDPFGWNLPFAEPKNKGPDRCWVVPARGGYVGGCEVGRAMATAYMKQLRSSSGSSGVDLQGIVLSLFARVEKAGGVKALELPLNQRSAEMTALKGHVVGFFAAINDHLITAARANFDGLDRIN